MLRPTHHGVRRRWSSAVCSHEVPSPGAGFPVFPDLSSFISSSGRHSLRSEFKRTGDQLIFLNCIHDHLKVTHKSPWLCKVQVKIVIPIHTSYMKRAFP